MGGRFRNMGIMVKAEERVRFCDNCNAVIGWYATFCEECGLKVGAGERAGPNLAVREADSVERDLFRAHMRLVHRFREQTAQAERALRKIQKNLGGLESRKAKDPEKTILLVSEQLLDLEQEWEELQRGYNRQSESIEEEFLSRIDELEVDLELSPEHQEAVDAEIRTLIDALEALEGELREAGRYLDLLKARRRSTVVSLAGRPSGRFLLVLLALGLPAAGAAWGIVMARLPVRECLATLSPGVLVICALLFGLSRRG